MFVKRVSVDFRTVEDRFGKSTGTFFQEGKKVPPDGHFPQETFAIQVWPDLARAKFPDADQKELGTIFIAPPF